MKTIRVAAFVFIVSAFVGLGPPAHAAPQDDRFWTPHGNPVIRVWQDYLLKAGDDAGDIVVIAASATIDGHVHGDVVVVLGGIHLASTAVIDGSLTVVAGNATIAEGATIRQDFVVVGGGLEAPPGFTPGGQHVIIGATAMGDRLRSVLPWFSRGLLWGRLIVPNLGWVWGVVLLFLILSLALNLLLQEPVAACARTLAARPFSTFLTGLLVLLLTGPASLLLTATVVGIAVVPFLFCALLVAWIVGKVGVVRWIGQTATGHSLPETPPQAMRSVVIGFTALMLIYMVPVLGIVVWALVGVFGLGAASLAFLSALKRERPAAPASVKPPAPAPPPLLVPDLPGNAFTVASAEPFAPPTPAAAFIPPVPPPPAPSATSVLGTDLTLLPRATLLDRTAALVLDVILVMIMVGLFDHRPVPVIDLPIVPTLFFGYFVGFWAWKGTTIGGIVCNLRLTRTNGTPVRLVDAVVRGLSSLLSFAALGLGYLWILRDPEGQAWHDKIAGTYVVKVPRDFPLP
jgi:uncharacterized RDD family membrane protein YckC